MSGNLTAFTAILRRDLLLGSRHRSELVNPVVYYVVAVTVFVIAAGEDAMTGLAPAILWVAAVLAAVLSLEGMFEADLADGTLEQMLLTEHPLTLLVAARIAGHWLLYGLPLIVTAILLALLLPVPSRSVVPLLATLVLGTPVLSLVGSVLAALTVGLRGSGMLLALLILPLYIPVLIFAVGAVGNAALGLPVSGELYLLGAILALSITVMPPAAAAALRIRMG